MAMAGLRPLLYLLLYSVIISCNSSGSRQNLEEQIGDLFAEGKGTFALAWKNLDNGELLLLNADTVFHAASTMKTPVMIEAFRQAQEGHFNLDDSLIVTNEFYSIVDSSKYSLSQEDDSEGQLYNLIGSKTTIGDLIYRMIIRSSNLATNIIIDLVDAKKVTQTMRELGASKIEVLRGVEDNKAYELGLSNTTTARDLMRIYEQLASGVLVSPQANQQMIDILLDQQFNDIIPAELPEEVKVAHKTGSITAIHHDSGIVFLPDNRKYVLVLLSKDLTDFDLGTRTMAKVSGLIYRYVVSGR